MEQVVVRHSAYCGMSDSETFESMSEARQDVARRIRRYRRQGFPVDVLEPGESWEIQEPENCMMVPDCCGTISIRRVTFECQECGCEYDDDDDAIACCAD